MISYRDLLTVPYAENSRDVDIGLNCAGVCDTILQRLGYAAGSLPVTAADFAHALGLVEAGGVEGEGKLPTAGTEAQWGNARWTCIGTDPAAAQREGDVVLTRDRRGVHSYVVVDAVRRSLLTANREHGVFSVRLWALRGVEAVFRISRP